MFLLLAHNSMVSWDCKWFHNEETEAELNLHIMYQFLLILFHLALSLNRVVKSCCYL